MPEQFIDFGFETGLGLHPEEIDRRRIPEILGKYPWALQWAYNLDVLKGNEPNIHFSVAKYGPLFHLSASDLDPGYKKWFDVVTWDPDCATEGLVLAPYDKTHLLRDNKTGLPIITRFDPEQRTQALVERAYFLGQWNSRERGKYLWDLEQELKNGIQGDSTTPYPVRTHHAYDRFKPKRNGIVDSIRTFIYDRNNVGELSWDGTPAFSDFNYRRQFDRGKNSRNTIVVKGIENRIGREIRSSIALGAMYDASGSVDAIVTAAMANQLATLPRNGLYADEKNQLELARQVLKKLDDTPPPHHEYGDFLKEKWKKNVSVSLGVRDPDRTVELARKYVEMGITHFKVFTISANEQIIETCRKLRQTFGDTIELFAGQIANREEALLLIDDEICVDGLCLGHGGGRQCTSSKGGMAISTVELLDSLVSDERFGHVTKMVEGGVGEDPGVALIMGADGVYYFQRDTGAVIEGVCGDMLVQEKNGRYGIPYRGEASVDTSTQEGALSETLEHQHFNPAGRSKQTEGLWGFTPFQRKYLSMCFKIYDHQRLVAKMLADVGVGSIGELRKKLGKKVFGRNIELLRYLTSEADLVAQAYGNSK